MSIGRLGAGDTAIQPTIFDAAGDMLYATAADTPARLAIGSSAQVLTVSGGVPAWATATAPAFVGASAYKTTTQTLTNVTYGLLTFDAENFDTDSFHSTSTNTSRMTIPSGKAGKYLISGQIGFASNATGYRLVEVMKNASSIIYLAITPFSGDTPTLNLSYIMDCAVGDYIELRGYQNSGGNLNVIGTSQYSTFQVSYLGA